MPGELDLDEVREPDRDEKRADLVEAIRPLTQDFQDQVDLGVSENASGGSVGEQVQPASATVEQAAGDPFRAPAAMSQPVTRRPATSYPALEVRA